MRLADRFDGSAAPFEGDRSLEIRSLPANAKVSKATITLTPIPTGGEGVFEETIVPGGDARVSRGATKSSGTGFVEVDLHQRRTLRAVAGTNLSGANLQVEMGGIYLQLNEAGAIKSPGEPEFSVQNDGRLPGLTVSKFKLSRDLGAVDVTGVTVASVPLNMTARIGDLPPFFARIGETTQEQVSPDFATSIQAFLADAPVENGFYVVPLVLHSDSIARLSVALAIEYAVESEVLEAGVGEPLLPFDLSGQATTENKLLTIEIPAHRRIARRGIRGRVTGRFDEMRVLYPAQSPLVPVNTSGPVASISSDASLAQPIKLEVPVVAAAVDLLLAVQSRGALELDLNDDLDGKPGSTSLLPAPIRFEPPAPTGGQLSGQSDFTAKWLSVPLPAEFKFSQGTRYWLILHSLEGEADWRVEPAPGALASQPEPGLQCTKDDALSWREAIPPETGRAFRGLFRLRGRTSPYRMPIEMRIGPADPASEVPPQRVSLNRFATSGRVDFTLDFDELSKAANAYLESAASVQPAMGEHLVNGDFREWQAIGDQPNEPVRINLDSFIPAAVAVAPNGSRAYLVGAEHEGHFNTGIAMTTGGLLKVVDLPCGHLLEEKTVVLGAARPRSLVLSPDGSRAYVACAGELVVVDLLTSARVGAPFPSGPIVSLAISPDGALLFATGEDTLKFIDCTALQNFLAGGPTRAQDVTLQSVTLDFTNGAFVAAAPSGTNLYLAHAGGEEFRIFELASFELAGDTIRLGGDAAGIALTPDGTRVLVPIADEAAVAIVNLDSQTVIRVPLSEQALAIAADNATAYCAMADGSVGIIDLECSSLGDEPIRLDSGADSVRLAITVQGDRIVLANAGKPGATGAENSVTLIELGTASPDKWNVIAGEVSRQCLVGLPQPVLVLGSIRREEREGLAPSATAGISQVVPVVPSGRYELGFRALATTPDAFAEVIWRGRNCEAFPGERVPIQTLTKRPAPFLAALRNAPPLLAAHRKQLIAPEGVHQAEIRFIAAAGAVSAITDASFSGASERLANADFSLREKNGLAAWTLVLGAAAGATLLAVAKGVRVQNAGAGRVELMQRVPAGPLQFFTLEFEGRVERSSIEAAPQVELRWFVDDAPVGEPTTLKISADSLTTAAAQGRSPEATAAEIRLAVPSGAAVDVERVSLRFAEVIPVVLSFMSETVGEIAITDLRVVSEDIPPARPSLPDDGLCNASPAPGASGQDCCDCAEEVPAFDERSVSGPASFGFRRESTVRPVVLAARIPRLSPDSPQTERRIDPVSSLTEISLIGHKRAERLVAKGIDTAAKLAATPAKEIAELLKPGISPEQAERIRIDAAKSEP